MATYSLVPTSTVQSATGASFTCAAGTIAIAKVNCRNGGSFTINGVVVIATNTWSVLASSPVQYFTQPANGGGGFAQQTIFAKAEGGNLAPAGSAYASGTAMTESTQEFALVAGDVLLGSGNASYHIEVCPV